MTLNFSIKTEKIEKAKAWIGALSWEKIIVALATVISVSAIVYFYHKGWTVAYGDAESHLNIAKRVVHSLTPGFAQLGGIWLPLPHVLMIPFVYFDTLWRTGIAGAIISGISFVVSSLYLYKLTFLLTKSKLASFVAAVVFMSNLNILYMQSTPMTELPLIVFFILSSFYFVKFLFKKDDVVQLVLAALFAFCASLSRYDGWFLVMFEAGVLCLVYLPWDKIPRRIKEIKTYFNKDKFSLLHGRLVLFSVLAMFGIALWFGWDYLILGDPLYFTHSQFSAKSQQNEWSIRGMLPAHNNPFLSLLYYSVTAFSSVGVIVYPIAIAGLIWYLASERKNLAAWCVAIIMLVPFVFNVVTLFLGQSVIFIPHISPVSFEWRLFNVRYGVMMVPAAAVFFGYVFYKVKNSAKLLLSSLFLFQFVLFGVGYSKIISLEDGVRGLSSAIAKLPDVQNFINKEYDGGLVLEDDFARTMSIVRSTIPMQNTIYVGNKPFWEDSLVNPEKYARWIVMQENDTLWKNFINNQANQDHMYKYYVKVYTSPQILVFKRNTEILSEYDDLYKRYDELAVKK